MPFRLIKHLQRKRLKRILYSCLIAICAGMFVMLVFVASLPFLVSMSPVQNLVRQSLSKSLRHPLTWSNLKMTWADGLTLSGLRIGDGPAPLLRGSIDEVFIAPALGRGSGGRFGIDLTLRLRNVRADLAPGPPKPPPPKPVRDPLTLLAEALQKIESFDRPLPLDVRVKVDVAPLRLDYRDPATGRLLALEDFSLRLDLPSLASQPILSSLEGRVLLDGRELGQVRFKSDLIGLVTAGQRIRPASAQLAADVALPGATITARGGLDRAEGVALNARLDLGRLLTLAQPFLPPRFPAARGTLDLDLSSKIAPGGDLAAALDIAGSGLGAGGGALGQRNVGPFGMRLHQSIASDHRKQRVEFSGGSLSVPDLLDAAWSATVDNPSAAGRRLEARLGPLRLDLGQARALAAPFLGPDHPLRELEGALLVKGVKVKLEGPGNNGELYVEGASVRLPRLRLAQTGGALALEGLDLVLERADCPFEALQPTRLAAGLSWGVQRCELSGRNPVTAQGLGGKLELALHDINLKSGSPRKVTATAEGKQTFGVERLKQGQMLAVEKLQQQLTFKVRAGAKGEIEAAIPDMKVSAAALHAAPAGKRLAALPFSASLSATGLRLPMPGMGRPSLQRLTCDMAAGDFLRLKALAGLSADRAQQIMCSGTAQVALGRLTPFAAQFLPPGLSANGDLAADWDLLAPLPEKAPAAEKNPLRLARSGLEMLERGEVGLRLDNLNLRLPMAGSTVVVSGLQSPTPLRLQLPRKGAALHLEGKVLVAGVSGLPGAAGKLPPQHGSLAVDADLRQWKNLRLNEKLRIEPLGLNHEAEANVSRIDALLEEQAPFSTATLLRRLDATIFSFADARFIREQKMLPGGLVLSGSASGSSRVDLAAGRELRLRVSVKSRDLGAKLAENRVEGLNSELLVERSYALAARRGAEWIPLSVALVRPPAQPSFAPAGSLLSERIREDLHGEVNGPRRITARKVATRVAGQLLELESLEGDLLLDPGATGLDFLQAELLGGTLRARGMVDLKPDVPTIATSCFFSRLDTGRLFPAGSSRGEVRDNEVTGELILEAPLGGGQRALLEGMRLDLNIRKIASHILERALFSLDPYERNEQLVAQRKLLRLGDLKWLRLGANDGALHLGGEVQVKGVALELPRVERLRLSELPLRKELAMVERQLATARGFLDLLRADTLIIGPKGEISLKRRDLAE